MKLFIVATTFCQSSLLLAKLEKVPTSAPRITWVMLHVRSDRWCQNRDCAKKDEICLVPRSLSGRENKKINLKDLKIRVGILVLARWLDKQMLLIWADGWNCVRWGKIKLRYIHDDRKWYPVVGSAIYFRLVSDRQEDRQWRSSSAYARNTFASLLLKNANGKKRKLTSKFSHEKRNTCNPRTEIK